MISVVRITDKRFVSSPHPPLVRTRIEGPALHPDSPFTSLVKEHCLGIPVLWEPSILNAWSGRVKGSGGDSSPCRKWSFAGFRVVRKPKKDRQILGRGLSGSLCHRRDSESSSQHPATPFELDPYGVAAGGRKGIGEIERIRRGSGRQGHRVGTLLERRLGSE